MAAQIDFTSPDYLQNGTVRQQQAYAVLMHEKIFETLRPFDPILAGTIPINIDLPASDLDILCCFTDKHAFKEILTKTFSKRKEFAVKEFLLNGMDTLVTNFKSADFPVEIFAQPIPTRQQYGYRHMVIEHRLLLERGEDFRQQIIELKKKGYKTEPAFAHALRLTGDPYEALLKL